MNRLEGFRYTTLNLSGIELEVAERGQGRPILFLTSSMGIWGAEPFLEKLSSIGRLIVPTHPGFGYTDLPHEFTKVDDFVYLYLDLIDALDLDEVLLVGCSLGGWMAAELAVRDRSRLGELVLIDTLGFKFSGREERDIADMHGLPSSEMRSLLYCDPERFGANYKAFDDEEVVRAARAWESFAFIGWAPYMHNPKLHRRLHRITVPTLVLWGAEDGIVKPDYGRKIAERIPGARMELIDGAAHLPFVEQPEATLVKLETFACLAVA